MFDNTLKITILYILYIIIHYIVTTDDPTDKNVREISQPRPLDQSQGPHEALRPAQATFHADPACALRGDVPCGAWQWCGASRGIKGREELMQRTCGDDLQSEK